MWSSPPFSYSCSCALTSMKYTTSKKNKHGVMLKTGVSPFCSYVLRVCSLPNSCTKSCSLLSGALYCFIASKEYGTFFPFTLRPLSTKSGPRVTGDRDLTMISWYYWQTLSRSNELLPQYKSWSLSLSISFLDPLRECVCKLQKGD